jgi:signal transduction histidine kinase
LRQVLLNLTRNAIEAMQAQGGHLVLRARNAQAMVTVDVEDDGDHGGTIRVESRPGRTSFSVSLPVARDDPATAR